MAKALLALVGGGKKGGGGSAKVDAAQDLIDAVNDGNAKAVATAFATMYELCASESYDEDEEA